MTQIVYFVDLITCLSRKQYSRFLLKCFVFYFFIAREKVILIARGKLQENDPKKGETEYAL